MSAVNQPSKLYVSTQDSEYGVGSSNINITLPESILNATGVECSRAVIPNTNYPIPDYQRNFYFTLDTAGTQVQTLSLTNARNFSSVTDLVSQLNADATAANLPIQFSYDNDACRITVFLNGALNDLVVVTANNNKVWYQDINPFISPSTHQTTFLIPVGTYTRTAYAAMLQTTFNTYSYFTSSISQFTATVDTNGKLTFSYLCLQGGGNLGRSSSLFWPSDDPIAVANMNLCGAQADVTGSNAWVFQQSTAITPNVFTFSNPIQVTTYTLRLPASNLWPTPFALNTRLGYPDAGIFGYPGNTGATGLFLPNLIRTKVIYLCTNISMDDTLNANGSMRNCLAKIPCNSIFGGLTLYEPTYAHYGKIVPSTIQRINVVLLDDMYQLYSLKEEDTCEYEFSFRYSS